MWSIFEEVALLGMIAYIIYSNASILSCSSGGRRQVQAPVLFPILQELFFLVLVSDS